MRTLSVIKGRAKDVEDSYRVAEGCYIIGSLEKGVTVYNQQLRAHNLAWALWELKSNTINNIAIVGGGIAGITFAACLLSRFKESTKITLFEKLCDLNSIQQGSDTRWLHPRIYGWPEYGSRAPGASLPVLNWSEGRASDVARSTLREFSKFCNTFDAAGERLKIYLNLKNFSVDISSRRVDFIGERASRSGEFFNIGGSEGDSAVYDCIVIAGGFGLESGNANFPVVSYWRNDQLAQPILDGARRRYLVSGFGDGALVDLCRLTIERYRQDTIVYELFGPELEAFEDAFRRDISAAISHDANIYTVLESYDLSWLAEPIRNISARLRKDIDVILHISGRDGSVSTFPQIFSARSSILNRLLTYLLFRCGAFTLRYGELSSVTSEFGIEPANVICRYGAKTMNHLRGMIKDFDRHEPRLDAIKHHAAQTPLRLWEPGAFPSANNH